MEIIPLPIMIVCECEEIEITADDVSSVYHTYMLSV